MQPSMFNVRVPLEDRGEVFLMNTFTDAQLLVSRDVADLLDRLGENEAAPSTAAEREALATLWEHGFIVESREADRRRLEDFFHAVREDAGELRITVLTTLQCNFACDYCIQGDHGDYDKHASRMSLETAARVAEWTESRLDALACPGFVLTFFGGEPLLNLPVVYYLAERLWNACRSRNVKMTVNVVTNGLLLTPQVVDRLLPFGLSAVKITLDGDRETHDRMRPLRGGQGTFDKIVQNVRQIAGKCRVSIGGNFDEQSVESYPALLDFLREQDFADKLTRVAFKPVIRQKQATADRRTIPLTPVGAGTIPANDSCSAASGGRSSICDNCDFLDERMAELREETRKRGFATVDGVHMGPCEVHRRHAHTIGPDGLVYACPGFAGDALQAVDHIDGRHDPLRVRSAERFNSLAAWKECQECAFIPVCAGGCTVAAHKEIGRITAPNCHKASFEAGVISLARDAARAQERELVG